LEEEVKEAQEAAAKTNERNKQNFEREQAQRKAEAEEAAKHWSFGDGWTNYNGHYQVATVSRRGNICYLHGLVLGNNGTIGTVPEFCAPGKRLMFSVLRAGVTGRVDMLPNGRLLLVDGIKHGWLSLSGIAYTVDVSNSSLPVALADGWSNYGLTWRPSVVIYDSGLCLVSGLIKVTSPATNWTFFGSVPDKCRPDGRLVFSDCNHDHVTRVDMLPDGRFLKAGGYQLHGWVSLDGMIYSPQTGKSLQLAEHWHNYGASYRPANYVKIGDVCHLSGLITSTYPHWRDITVLPEECRPRARLAFACNNHATSVRIDVDVDGSVRYVSGRSEHNWVSLSCVRFISVQA